MTSMSKGDGVVIYTTSPLHVSMIHSTSILKQLEHLALSYNVLSAGDIVLQSGICMDVMEC